MSDCPAYFDRYETLAFVRTPSGVLTVRLHSGGGPVAYRAAHALIRIGDPAGAHGALERVVNSRRDVPAVILAAACVDYASLIERSRDRSAAIALYQRAQSIVGSHPDTRSVRGANVCRIAVHRPRGGDIAVILSVIDNLVKGASGQAVQNMNIMFGLPETTGLEQLALLP